MKRSNQLGSTKSKAVSASPMPFKTKREPSAVSRAATKLAGLVAILFAVAFVSGMIGGPADATVSTSDDHSPPAGDADAGGSLAAPAAPVALPIKKLNKFPHDTNCFTQGLEFHKGVLYESCGHYGRSNIRIVDMETGKPTTTTPLDLKYFAEGLTIFNDKVFLITWREHVGIVYDLDLQPIQEFIINTTGWGLTNDGISLIYSDGTDKIFYLNPETFELERTLSVKQVGAEDGNVVAVSVGYLSNRSPHHHHHHHYHHYHHYHHHTHYPSGVRLITGAWASSYTRCSAVRRPAPSL